MNRCVWFTPFSPYFFWILVFFTGLEWAVFGIPVGGPGWPLGGNAPNKFLASVRFHNYILFLKEFLNFSDVHQFLFDPKWSHPVIWICSRSWVKWVSEKKDNSWKFMLSSTQLRLSLVGWSRCEQQYKYFCWIFSINLFFKSTVFSVFSLIGLINLEYLIFPIFADFCR